MMFRALLSVGAIVVNRAMADDSAFVCDWLCGSLPPRFFPGCRAKQPYAPASTICCTFFQAEKHYQRGTYNHFKEDALPEERLSPGVRYAKGHFCGRLAKSFCLNERFTNSDSAQ